MGIFDNEQEEALRLRNQALNQNESPLPSPVLQPPVTTLDDKDVVRNYLLKKMEAEKQAEEQKRGLGWKQALSGAFAGLGGGADAVYKNNQQFDNYRKQIDEDTVGKVERDEKERIQSEKQQRDDAKFNPNSEESVNFRNTVQAIMPNIAKAYGKNWEKVTAADSDSLFNFTRLEQMKQEKADALNVKRQEVAEKKAYLASPDGKREKLNASDKVRFDNARMAIQALDEMEKALDAGQNTFSVIGDNDFTAAERRATEAYGRMQSGGAINRDEEARFRKTLPGMTDSAEMQKKKIQIQREEMQNRLKTLGFSPESIEPVKKEAVSPPSNKPKSISQNGHTYILNEATGEYE